MIQGTSFCRQQNGSWQVVGKNIEWEILRAPPVDTPPCVRYISDCLEDLKPGDHIEIQWKSRREFAYGRFTIFLVKI